MLLPESVDDAERVRQIKRVLSVYDGTFTQYFAATISITEKIPEEINNQIRNAMTHLARAQDASTATDFQREIERSLSHIQRANRDCLKASIIVSREKLERLAAEARFYFAKLTPDIEDRLRLIKKKRQEASQAETQGRGNIIELYEEQLRDILYTSELIIEQYKNVGTKRAWIAMLLWRWSHPVYTVIALVVGYLLHPFTQPIVQVFSTYIKNKFGSH